MSYAIVYSSRTGNTKRLAYTVRHVLPGENCVYFGAPDAKALEADRIYVGFWTDKGSCDKDTQAFLKTLTDQELFLFGTAGTGGNPDYYEQVLQRAQRFACASVSCVGTFMCQGKMPQSVRERYEKMGRIPGFKSKMKKMMENFDQALTRPDSGDCADLENRIRSCSAE